MIYPKAKYQKICKTTILSEMILAFVGDVTQSLSVSREFVPIDYVKSIKVIDKITITMMTVMLRRRPRVQEVHLYKSLPCGNF